MHALQEAYERLPALPASAAMPSDALEAVKEVTLGMLGAGMDIHQVCSVFSNYAQPVLVAWGDVRRHPYDAGLRSR